jgi:hypothetical protein
VPRCFGDAECIGSRFLILRAQTGFDDPEGDGSCFHVLRVRTSFRRYRGRRVPFSCFALPDTFSAERMASVLIFMFSSPELIFDGTEGVRSRFHVLRAWTHFWWYRGRRFPFSCFARPDSFSAVPRASGTIFKFYTPEHVFGSAECVGSHFHFYAPGLVFTFCAPKLVSTVPFSYFACRD